jgi:heme exporter protein C
MSIKRVRIFGLATGLLGVIGVIIVHWLVFFWVPTESQQGIVQRIFYVHVPSAWVAFMAFGIVALVSAIYLWLGDEKLDMAASAAAEGGMVFTTIVLLTGPLWGRVAWGTWWTWEPRLTLTLLLWFIYLGYFLVRKSTTNPEQGRKFAAVVGIVGAVDIPLIHISVSWLRSLHPQPVVMKPEGPTLDGSMLSLLGLSILSFSLLFFGLFITRYAVARLEHAAERRAANSVAPAT